MLERKHHYQAEKTLVANGKILRATPTTDFCRNGVAAREPASKK